MYCFLEKKYLSLGACTVLTKTQFTVGLNCVFQETDLKFPGAHYCRIVTYHTRLSQTQNVM